MKANELRIGNYVGFGEPCKVFEIQKNCFYVENSEGVEFKNTICELTPIPLTEEILLKCGFERHHADYFNETIYIKNVVGNTEFEWGVYPNELGSGFVIKNSINIKYLHQLQNLYFALTNEELNINL